MSNQYSELLVEAQADLEAALELDDAKLAKECRVQIETLQGKISALASTPSDQLEVTAEDLGLKPAVETSAVEGDNSNMSQVLTITKESLGVTGFDQVLAQLSLETIDKMIHKVQGTNAAGQPLDLVALVLPGWTQVDPAKRIHVGDERGDVKRAARGAALAAAGAIQEGGDILSNSGRIYTIRDGRCFRLEQQPQVNFDQSETMLVKEVPYGPLQVSEDQRRLQSPPERGRKPAGTHALCPWLGADVCCRLLRHIL